jgi:hypothetical protein
MSEEDRELSEFLNSTIESIRKATNESNVGLIGPIEIEVAVITKKEAGGKFKLIIVEAGVDYQKEKISKIKLSVGSKEGMYRNFVWNIPLR